MISDKLILKIQTPGILIIFRCSYFFEFLGYLEHGTCINRKLNDSSHKNNINMIHDVCTLQHQDLLICRLVLTHSSANQFFPEKDEILKRYANQSKTISNRLINFLR